MGDAQTSKDSTTKATTAATPTVKRALQKRSGLDIASDYLQTAWLLLTVTVALLFSIIYTIFAAFKCLVPRKFRRHDITGKVVLITGGGSGIGRLVIQRLAAKGAKVVTWDVNEAGNAETVRLLQEAGYECYADTVDICNKEAVYKSARSLTDRGLQVDILINNAGIVTGRNFLESPDEYVVRTFQVNVISHFWTAKAFLPAMLKSNSGHIVTIASMAGKVGVNKLIDYCASKFATVGFDESLRAELMVNKKDGVFTTLVCPYYINTGMFDGVRSKLIPILEPEFVADEIVDGILLRSKEVVLPWYSNVFVWLKLLLHYDAQKFMLCKVTGVSKCLDGFVGRTPPTLQLNGTSEP
uniref:Short-chain dehydrogenase/reductase 3 n=2 Tax=Hirondellea gigas TaxID=1518452 RepID=A0A6A7FZ56_9CRUS